MNPSHAMPEDDRFGPSAEPYRGQDARPFPGQTARPAATEEPITDEGPATGDPAATQDPAGPQYPAGREYPAAREYPAGRDDAAATQDPDALIMADSEVPPEPEADPASGARADGRSAPAAVTTPDFPAEANPGQASTATPGIPSTANPGQASTATPGFPAAEGSSGLAVGGGQRDATSQALVTDRSSETDLDERWHEIQMMFVDDPRGSVERAADLARDTLRDLSSLLQEREQSLRSAWQGTDVDTEELRTSLRGYRALVDRITEVTHQP
jgi:hypothetical protein